MMLQCAAWRLAWAIGSSVLVLAIGCGETTPMETHPDKLVDASLGNGEASVGDVDREGGSGLIVTDVISPDLKRDTCTARVVASERPDIDLFFVVATSATMSANDDDSAPTSRFDRVSNAVVDFVAHAMDDHLGAGVFFYPALVPGVDGGVVEACSSSEYLDPAVPWAPLDAAGTQVAAIATALRARSLAGGNTLAAALEGALRRAAQAKALSGRMTHVVLITDATADPCGADAAVAAGLARATFEKSFVETYVVAVGPDAPQLDAIAVAGGTFHAYRAGSRDEIKTSLDTIGVTLRRCRFHIPALAADEYLRFLMMIDYGEPGEQVLFQLVQGSLCADQPGYLFDRQPMPRQATICPAPCEALLRPPERKLDAVIGCW